MINSVNVSILITSDLTLVAKDITNVTFQAWKWSKVQQSQAEMQIVQIVFIEIKCLSPKNKIDLNTNENRHDQARQGLIAGVGIRPSYKQARNRQTGRADNK